MEGLGSTMVLHTVPLDLRIYSSPRILQTCPEAMKQSPREDLALVALLWLQSS
ncbi:hypothetical protein AVEN_245421-1, partial [Araneus ventricosus]